MQAIALWGRQRRLFIQAIRRTVSITCPYHNQTTSIFKFFCTQTATKFLTSNTEPELEKPKCLSLRIERLQRGEPVGSAFQSWMGEGFPIHRGEIFHTINRLRKLQLNKRALEVNVFLFFCTLSGMLIGQCTCFSKCLSELY